MKVEIYMKLIRCDFSKSMGFPIITAYFLVYF